MAQTQEGARKASAKKAGMTLEEFLARFNAGQKRCTKCKEWKNLSCFGQDKTRWDGVNSACFDCRHVKEKKNTKGRPSAFKGKTHTPEALLKMSESARKRPSNMLGKKHTDEARSKISKATREHTARGERHYNYKHGEAIRNLNGRRTPEYKAWRDAVFCRDSYTCQRCGDSRGGNLRAHHIKPYAEHPELRYDVDNGTTLCHTCHELEHFKPDSIRNIRKLKRGEKLWG